MPEGMGYGVGKGKGGGGKNATNIPSSRAKKAPIKRSGTEQGTKYGQNPHARTSGKK